MKNHGACKMGTGCYFTDDSRYVFYNNSTGIYVRAWSPVEERWVKADVAELDYDSFSLWVDQNPRDAKRMFLSLLGHRQG